MEPRPDTDGEVVNNGSHQQERHDELERDRPAKFHPGQVVATPGALEAIRASGQTPEVFLGAHLEGHWGGDLCEEDRRLNDEALIDGSRLLSAYKTLRGEQALDHHRGRGR